MLAIQSGVQLPAAAEKKWRHLNETVVVNRLKQLMVLPNLLNQGALGLCGEATFMRHVLKRDTPAFFAMAYTLFLDGACVIGKLLIDPDPDLLNANYPQIVTNRGTTFPPIPQQADWMLLSALRDSQNEILDFEGRPEETEADGSDFQERADWYEKSGLYTTVAINSDTTLAAIGDHVTKITKNHISLRIKIQMINPARTGNHVVSLETPLMIDEANDRVEFYYWSWGAHYQAQLTVSEFTSNYLGAIIATF